MKARKVRHNRLGDACHWWAFSMLTKSAGGRAHYDKRRALGEHHNAACATSRTNSSADCGGASNLGEPWDDDRAWPTGSLLDADVNIAAA